MDEEREVTEACDLLTKEADVFARCPGMDDFRRRAVGEKARPIAVNLVEAVNGIILLAQTRAALGIFGNSNRRGMAEGRELVREVVDMDSAVGAEVMIKDKKDIT